MSQTTRRVSIDRDSELGKALEAARRTGDPVELEVGGTHYGVAPRDPNADDPWAGYDPASIRAALRKVAGSWADLDAERLIAEVYRGRDEGSRPAG